MLDAEFTGYILTGGKSSRMGTDKAFLKIGEKTFIENAADILRPNCAAVKSVINKTQNDLIEKLSEIIPHIFDIYENRGALGGIHAALDDCKTEFAAILAVDLPFLTSETIKKLCKIAAESDRFSAVVPNQIDDRPQPLCAVYRAKTCLPKAKEILSKTESASVRNFLETINPIYVDAENLSADEKLFRNINYPKDFHRMILRI